MLFDDQTLRARVSWFVLLTTGWLTAGGPAWAEARAARRDPAVHLLRLADDPRLPLAPEQRRDL
ncbi:MAG TPA: hypothetical protein VHQ65_16675, partial [Thermoanaerobaculia bacterium]|nr:hypothetical protein [Thermoanaerobaculia bacterium]